MQPIWNYQDIVGFLSHPNSLVRRWAFDIIKVRYSRKFTPEVSNLIGDQNEHLACAAPNYLADHQVISFGPAILDSFLNDKGLVPGNCAKALGIMKYEEAFETIVSKIPETTDSNTFMGIISYLGNIYNDDSHQILLDIMHKLEDEFLWEYVAKNILNHRNTDDISLILDKYFFMISQDTHIDGFLKNIIKLIDANSLFRDFDEYTNLLNEIDKFFEEFKRNYPAKEMISNIEKDIIDLINKKGNRSGRLCQ